MKDPFAAADALMDIWGFKRVTKLTIEMVDDEMGDSPRYWLALLEVAGMSLNPDKAALDIIERVGASAVRRHGKKVKKAET